MLYRFKLRLTDSFNIQYNAYAFDVFGWFRNPINDILCLFLKLTPWIILKKVCAYDMESAGAQEE